MKRILIAIGVVFGVQQAQAQFRSNINAYYNYDINSNQGIYIRSNNDNFVPNGAGPENIRFQIGNIRNQSFTGGGDFTNNYVAEINNSGFSLRSGTRINFIAQAFSSVETSGRLTFIADSDNGGNNGAHANDDFRFRIGTSEKLLIQRSLTTLKTDVEFQGKLGIGTNDPQQRFHLRNGNIFLDDFNGQFQTLGNVDIRPDRGSLGNDAVIFRNTSNQTVTRIQDGNIELTIRNNNGGELRSSGALKLRPESDGNGNNDYVDFYNSNNQLKTRIQDGIITTDQVRLNVTTFPDYVFAKDYQLMPLKEVAQYIKSNKHLPNMPTEAQVVAEGMNIGQINTILVEKVEELTLHTISQEEKIEKLMKKIEALEATINK